MKILLICLLVFFAFTLLFGVYVLILFFRKKLVFSKAKVKEGFFYTIGQRNLFWILKNKRFVFKVVNGQIVSVRDLQHPLLDYKYGGEMYGDN